MAGFKDALMRTAMMAATPQTKDELYLLADALRVWQAHPELRNEVVVKTGATPDRMLARIAMVLALVKFGVEPMPENMPEDYTPPADDTDESEESD